MRFTLLCVTARVACGLRAVMVVYVCVPRLLLSCVLPFRLRDGCLRYAVSRCVVARRAVPLPCRCLAVPFVAFRLICSRLPADLPRFGGALPRCCRYRSSLLPVVA